MKNSKVKCLVELLPQPNWISKQFLLFVISIDGNSKFGCFVFPSFHHSECSVPCLLAPIFKDEQKRRKRGDICRQHVLISIKLCHTRLNSVELLLMILVTSHTWNYLHQLALISCLVIFISPVFGYAHKGMLISCYSRHK